MDRPLPLVEFPEETLDWVRLLPPGRPVQIEIGAGKGRFLIRSAEADPASNWIGLEVRWAFIALAVERIVRRGLDNALYVRCDASEVVRRFIAPESVAAFHVYYPDPWWKERHRKRRLVSPSFVSDVARALRGGGLLRVATDVGDYRGRSSRSSQRTLLSLSTFPTRRTPEGEPLTSYEAKSASRARHTARALVRNAARPPPELRLSRRPHPAPSSTSRRASPVLPGRPPLTGRASRSTAMDRAPSGPHPVAARGRSDRGSRYVPTGFRSTNASARNDAPTSDRAAGALDLPSSTRACARLLGANDRIHTFILEGAIDLAHALAYRGIRYLFHLERRPSAASGLLAALARDAALVITDDFPVFIVPGQARALARQIERPVAAIDASCVVPWSIFPKVEIAARTLRPKLHRALPHHLQQREDPIPRRSSADLDVPFPYPRGGLEAEERDWLDLSRNAPSVVSRSESDLSRSPEASPDAAARRTAPDDARRIAEWVESCAIDHRIGPSPILRGGTSEGRRRLDEFVATRLASYPEDRNDPAREGTSGFSPYLHFGQISALEVAIAVLEGSGPRNPRAARGQKGVRDHSKLDPAELIRRLEPALMGRDTPEGAFLEQLLVRRELSFNFCAGNPRHASYEGLPGWARETLERHSLDPREALYDRETLEWSETKDGVWNAAQSELRLTGVIHNRMRMLWGKKILEWSESPDEAIRTMIDLHDRYALDGRDPNTYANILWCLGLHDRPFGPERPVTGLIRPMSTAIAEKKLDLAIARLATYERE
jgi:deoxyribodipyrimidine photo-lyase